MSKMDDLRAMREARYAERVTRPTVVSSTPAPVEPRTATRSRRAAPLAVVPDAVESAVPTVPTEAVAGLCGHRAISGRTCTREAGHSEKSHRYS